MDLTILYRVLWKPSTVFREFKDRQRIEPFIFICAAVVIPIILAYKNDIQQIVDHPSLLLTGLLQGFFFSLLFPGLEALTIFLSARLIFNVKSNLLTLLSAFILCGLPQYISTWLTIAFGYPAIYVGLGGLFSSLRETHPFLFGVLASITPFFIWVVILWHAALNQLVTTSKRQITILLSVLILFGLTIGGLWRMFAVLMFNIFNPAK